MIRPNRAGAVGTPALVLGLLMLASAPAAAATFKPTRFNDPPPNKCKPSDCSLREAVIAANRHSGKDTIRLAKGTYELTRAEAAGDPNDSRFGDLDLTGDAKVVGAGARKTAVDAGRSADIGGILHVQGSFNAYALRDLTLQGGTGTDPGGGIRADNIGGSLSVVRMKVTDSYSGTSGGGVYSAAAELKITKSTIADNRADNQGGGIFLPATGGAGPAITSIRSSTISGNLAASDGGGLAANGTDVGGFPNPPQVTVVNSTFAQNETSGSGGGVRAVQGATVALDNVTVAYNDAETDGAGNGTGGGISRAASAGQFAIGDVLVAANTVGATGNGAQCAGAFTGQNGNVVQLQAGTSCSISGGLSEPADALIGPLANNGGTTKTVALLDGSAAIGFAEACPAKDQRGLPRPAADCDAGAFEHQGP
jgi:hypothetical protein